MITTRNMCLKADFNSGFDPKVTFTQFRLPRSGLPLFASLQINITGLAVALN